MHRSDEEKTSLTLYRYKNWVSVLENDLRQLNEIQRQHVAIVDHMSYLLLEAREEQARLIESGLSKEEIEKIAVLPQIPIDPLAILKQAQNSEPSIEDVLKTKV